MKTFYEYLAEMEESGAAAERNDPAGDFALDAEADSFFPRDIKADEEGFTKIINYLYYSKYVRDIDIWTAFMDCWEMYYREVTGSTWYW